jgi:hypothetical protein
MSTYRERPRVKSQAAGPSCSGPTRVRRFMLPPGCSPGSRSPQGSPEPPIMRAAIQSRPVIPAAMASVSTSGNVMDEVSQSRTTPRPQMWRERARRLPNTRMCRYAHTGLQYPRTHGPPLKDVNRCGPSGSLRNSAGDGLNPRVPTGRANPGGMYCVDALGSCSTGAAAS